MRLLKVAAVTLPFLLIPHQAPLAGPADGSGPAALGDRLDPAADRTPSGSEAAGSEAMRTTEGFMWSAAATGSSGDARLSSSDHLQTDGYSWSARSSGPDSAPASNF